MIGVSACNTITADQNEYDKVGVKLVDNKNAVVVVNNQVYNGTYVKANDATAEITCSVDAKNHNFNYVLKDGVSYIEEVHAETGAEAVLSEKVVLDVQEDYLFDTGLWMHRALCTISYELDPGVSYELVTGGDYFTLNIDHNTIYTGGASDIYSMKLNVIGDMVIYSFYTPHGEPTKYVYLFFVKNRASMTQSWML